MDKYTLPTCTALFSNRLEIPVTFEATLPEYCRNVRRILRTDAFAAVENTGYSDGLLRVNVMTNVHVVYISEPNGHQKSVTFPFEFEHTFDASGINASDVELTVEAKAAVISANALPKGPRTMEIKMNTAVSACIYDCTEIHLLSCETAPDTELNIRTCPATKHIKLSDRPEKLREDITLDAQMPAIAEITDYSCKILLDSVKPSEGALNYSGNAVLKCTYRAEPAGPEAENTEYVYLTKEIPFSGEILSPDITSSDTATGYLVLTGLEADSSFDPYGENRIINAVMGYEAAFDVFSPVQTEYADDGYCMLYECDFVKNTYKNDLLCGKINDKTEITERLSAERTQLTQITDSGMKLCAVGTEISEGKLYVSGKMNVWIYGSDEKGEPDCMQTTINVRYPLESVTDIAPDRKYIVNPQIVSGEATLRDGEIILKAQIRTDGAVLERQTIEAVSEARVAYESPKPVCKSEYVVYYPEAGERMWDIAKKYEVSQKELAEANGVSGNELSGRKTVVIPCRS